MKHTRTVCMTWTWDIPEGTDTSTISLLDQSAKIRVDDMWAEGFKCGQLCEDVDDVSYTGWWEVAETGA